MAGKISKIIEGSIASEMGVESGDIVLAINGTTLHDIIDYRFLTYDENIVMEVQKKDGEVWELDIEKEFDEELGIEFETAIMDKAKSCCNKCVFCFIDQLPKGLRNSLYFKDDDSRLSFLQGNFVTLTNMSEDDIDRIIRYRISPINISVHTTNPELRQKMLNNRFAGNIYERLKKLAEASIKLNCQIVLCPGLNNGEELNKTVEDLYKLYPSIENVAAVPVGVTKFREGLYELKLYDKESAAKEISDINKLQNRFIKKNNTPFVRLSDEFYVTAGIDIPDESFYGEYEQLEDGIGMISYFRKNIRETIKNLKKNVKGSFSVITGVSAYEELNKAALNIKIENNQININVFKVINNFFGEHITVAGLLTGKDIMEQVDSKDDYLIIPQNMLRSGEEVFLDDITISDLEKHFKTKVLIANYTGEDLINIINEHCEEV